MPIKKELRRGFVRKEHIINFKYGLKVVAKESSDIPPLGIIIDVYHKDKHLNSLTYWYSEFEEWK